MDQSEKEIQKPEQIKRPPSLTVLCILSFLGCIINIITYLYFSLFYNMLPAVYAQLEKNGFAYMGINFTKAMKDDFKSMLDLILSRPREFFLFYLICSVGAFYGTLQIWKLKKTGFHIYTISQLMIIIISMIYIGISVSSGTTFLTGAFIMLYAMNLKYMVK